MSTQSTTQAQNTFYISPTTQGTGIGDAANNAAQYTDLKFWQHIQETLSTHPVTIHLSSL